MVCRELLSWIDIGIYIARPFVGCAPLLASDGTIGELRKDGMPAEEQSHDIRR